MPAAVPASPTIALAGTLTSSTGYPLVAILAELAAVELETGAWAALASRLREHRVARLHLVAQHLCGAAEPDIFADWELEVRHGLLGRLNDAFLDQSVVLRAVIGVPS